MAVEAGDAIFRFLGDSSNLDVKFAEVGPNAQKAFEPAAEAAENAGERMSYSMREARGEVALLGEEVGVRLPRHVQRFIAELPTVGPALSAAFSATAIMFVAQAVVQLAHKLSEALAEFIYAKSIMDEHTASVVSLNNELVNLTKQYEELKQKADDYGKSALQLATEHKGQVKESITDLNKSLHDEEEQFKALIKAENQHVKTVLSASAAYTQWKAGNLSAMEAWKAYTFGIETSTLKHKEHDAIENQLIITEAKLKNAHQESRVATNNLATAQAELNKKGAALEEQISKSANEINRLNIALSHTKVEASQVEIITPTRVQEMLKGIAAAHDFSIVLRSDLVQAYQAARKAEIDFANSHIDDAKAAKQLSQNVDEARKALENYGTKVDTFKAKSHGMWKEFKQDAKDGATTIDQVKQIGVTAFDDLTKGFESAIQSAILSQGSFTQALEKATASALASIASQAIVKALFYTAEGFAALAGFEEQSASEYFSAAGIMGAVGAAAGLAAHAMNGGGGGTTNTQQGNTSQSNTGSQAGRSSSGVSIQHFAEGGLITAPTLALMGEAGREAVIPLDNPRAKQQMGDAGMGGTHFHINVEGLISPDNLTKVVKKISDRVNRGQLHLQASNTFRITKRSA
jgi:hypothetical protein